MYNEEIKRRYIKERTADTVLPNNYLNNQFSYISGEEEELGKDCCNFTYYEIINYYKTFNTSSVEYLLNLNSQLSLYTQWCMKEGLVLDGQNHYLHITFQQIMDQCVNRAFLEKKIISREELLANIETLPNKRDQFILLSFFEFGKNKSFSDLLRIKLSDFNGNELTLQSGRTVKVSDRLVYLAKDADAEEMYMAMNGKFSKQVAYAPSEYIIKWYPSVKSTVNQHQEGRRLYNGLIRIFDYLGSTAWSSSSALVEAGKIHMIKERAAHYNMTPREYLYSPLISEINEQFGCKVVRSQFAEKYKNYL